MQVKSTETEYSRGVNSLSAATMVPYHDKEGITLEAVGL